MKDHEMCPVPPGSGLKSIYGSGLPGLYELIYVTTRDRVEVIQRRQQRFGDITYMNLFGRKIVLPMSPETVEAVAMNKNRAFANEPAWDFFIGLAFKRGILLMDFEEHRRHRLIMQQAFAPNNLKGYLQEMQPMIEDRIRSLPTGPTRLAHDLKAITLDMALEVFVGVKLPRAEADRLNHAFLDCIAAMSALIRRPLPGSAWMRTIKGRRTLEEFFYSQLPNKRRRDTPDLFSVLCHARTDEGETFTDDDVVNHMIFVLFAAHDTSTTALSTMAYYLARDPMWQRRAREQSLGLPEELSYDHLKQMDQLDLILKEALRLNPPVPMLARQAIIDTDLNGHFIPKGTFVAAMPQSVHLNPTVWRDPLKFDPERFLPERAEDKGHRFAWFPFGGGVHKCIGLYFAQMEIKTTMHHLLRQHEWSVEPNYRWRPNPRSLGEPLDGLQATLSRRG